MNQKAAAAADHALTVKDTEELRSLLSKENLMTLATLEEALTIVQAAPGGGVGPMPRFSPSGMPLPPTEKDIENLGRIMDENITRITAIENLKLYIEELRPLQN